MPLYSVQTLINRAASIADVHDNFVSAQTWLDWFNSERKALIISRARSGHAEGILDSTSLTGAGGSLTVEPWAILGVWEVSTNGRYRRLTHIDAVASFAFRGITGFPTHWTFERDTEVDPFTSIALWPAGTTETFVCWYLDTPTIALTLADQFPFDIVDDERIVLGMARRALIKEESDTREVDREIARFEAMVEENAWGKAMAETPAVRNVDAEVRGWESRLILPPYSSWYWV